MSKRLLLVFPLLFVAVGLGQKPVAQLPQTYIDTTFNLPTGVTWQAHTVTTFKSALTSANPGDIIVLDAGVTYQGNFTLPKKNNPNHLWIYIVGSALSNLPTQGTRVNPATDSANMPKIVTTNSTAALTLSSGADFYRLVGLEVYSASNYGCNRTAKPPQNCYSYQLLNATWSTGQTLADSITVDRSYFHGSPTEDITRAIAGNISNLAVVDSYISDIHAYDVDSQAIGLWYSPGPIKIVNNYLEATGENVMFGGAGGVSNPYVASDIEIRDNYFYKDPVWEAVGVTIPPNNPWIVKNHLEFKSARRVIVDSNMFENVWVSGQVGYSVLLTVRTSESGNIAVVDDITISNNIFKNVVAGFQTGAHDSECPTTPGCTNSGEVRRIDIYNNLIGLHNPALPGYYTGFGIILSNLQSDMIFQHNTVVPYSGAGCSASVYFSNNFTSFPPPSGTSSTSNIWVLDNALCQQPTGDWQWQGMKGLPYAMGNPTTPPYDLTQRFYGNVMYVPPTNKTATWPLHNYATTVPFTYVDYANGDYQLVTPYWTDTSDGQISGISFSTLP